MKATILVGDCRERMAAMEPGSIDAIVTDPPYGLSFMGKGWDHGVPGEEFWTAALHVAKPGAHLLAFGGTRTHHRLICAIEDAGWEIRDCLSWLYGSGFPKSLDVSKAIDRKRYDGEQIRAVTRWVAASRTAARITNADIDAAFGFNGMAGHWTTQGEQAAVPTLDQWPRLMRVLNVESVPPEIQTLAVDLNGHKGQPGASWFQREVVGRRSGAMNNSATSTASSFTKGDVGWNPEFDVTSPATDAARLWSGWGTALKPAWEPIVLARKPLTATVAANVQRFATGAININACRIASGPTAIMNAWEQEQYRCASCVERAARIGKLEAPASRGSTATKRVERTSSAKGSTRRTDTSRADIGCSVGPSQAEPNTGLAADSNSNTGESGSSTTVESAPDLSSITSTRTSSTTESRTCNSCGVEITSDTTKRTSTGRWPSNVLLDEEAAAQLDEMSGERGGGFGVRGRDDSGQTYGGGTGLNRSTLGQTVGFGDSGGASRFFFTAKASSADRNDGLEGVEGEPAGRTVKPRHGDRFVPKRNSHPTVKPFDLMRWLVRLVTPPGGTVLDPFAGSGSTGVAALAESFNFIGIELDPTYAAIAERRIANVAPLLAEVQAETAAKKEPETQFELDITGAP